MDNQQARLTDLAYLAGVIDGEGWIGLQKHRGRRVVDGYQLSPIIAVHVKSPEWVEHIDALMRRNNLPSYIQRSPSHIASGTARWAVKGMKRSKRVLEALRPFLVEKAKPADLVLEYIESRLGWEYGKGLRPRELEIYDDLRVLNGRK